MTSKTFILLLVLFISLSSEAQLRCFSIFANNEINSPQYFAEVVDTLNSKYNNFLFTENLADRLDHPADQSNFIDQTRARLQAFKLKRMMKSLKSASSWDRYDFETFAARLERLTFLTDSSVLKNMTAKDKILYAQARHTLLARGLEDFLFVNTMTSPSMKRKIFEWVMTPFKDIYSRWTFAMFTMPKLNGAVLPSDLAAKIAWEGLDKNAELLKPYLLHSQFKSYFNVFSVTYNWSLVAALFIGFPSYAYLTYSDLQEKGTQQVQVLFSPLVQHSQEMAQTDFHHLASEKSIQYFTDEFKLQYGREPNSQELEIVKKIKGY